MRFLLAADDGAIPLVLTRFKRAERGAELIELPTVLRPVARALRRDGPIVVRLRLSQQLSDRA